MLKQQQDSEQEILRTEVCVPHQQIPMSAVINRYRPSLENQPPSLLGSCSQSILHLARHANPDIALAIGLEHVRGKPYKLAQRSLSA